MKLQYLLFHKLDWKFKKSHELLNKLNKNRINFGFVIIKNHERKILINVYWERWCYDREKKQK